MWPFANNLTFCNCILPYQKYSTKYGVPWQKYGTHRVRERGRDRLVFIAHFKFRDVRHTRRQLRRLVKRPVRGVDRVQSVSYISPSDMEQRLKQECKKNSNILRDFSSEPNLRATTYKVKIFFIATQRSGGWHDRRPHDGDGHTPENYRSRLSHLPTSPLSWRAMLHASNRPSSKTLLGMRLILGCSSGQISRQEFNCWWLGTWA